MRSPLSSAPLAAICCLSFSAVLRSSAADSEAPPDFKEAIQKGAGQWGGAPLLEIRGEVTGPDGRIYWFTGDGGYSFTTAEGCHFDRPQEAGVFCCDPDGSNTEEFFRGLRSPIALVFDDLGNLLVCDRDPDSEDAGRVYYGLEGGDAGWRGEWIETALALPPVGTASPNRFLQERKRAVVFSGSVPESASFLLAPPHHASPPGIQQPDRLASIRDSGKIARRDAARLPALIELLGDADAEVRAQAAKALADSRTETAGKALVAALNDGSPRVRSFAAIGVGKCRIPQALEKLLEILAENDNRDAFLRHACIHGLWFLNEREKMLKQVAHDSAAVRLGILLTLRKLGDPRVKYFLEDPEPGIRLEAESAVSVLNSAAGPEHSRG